MLQSMSNKLDLILIRHAQSNFNRGYYDFLKNNDLNLEWQDCIKREDFNSIVAYAKQHIDCSLSPVGIEQCSSARQKLNKQDVQIVLVSPLERTLETCQEIFQGRNVRVEVHPILSEVFRFACDVGGHIEQKQKRFNTYDFSHMNDASELWFVENLAPCHQQSWKSHIELNQNLSYKQKQEQLLHLLKSKVIYESDQQLRERAYKIKLLLAQYRKKYKNIVVISHYSIIKAMLAKQYNELGEIINVPYIKNAELYYQSLDNLLQYK